MSTEPDAFLHQLQDPDVFVERDGQTSREVILVPDYCIKTGDPSGCATTDRVGCIAVRGDTVSRMSCGEAKRGNGPSQTVVNPRHWNDEVGTPSLHLSIKFSYFADMVIPREVHGNLLPY